MLVSIVPCSNYEICENAIRKALKDINFEIKENSKVLIKPNVLGGHSPELAVTTHPKIIESIVKICLEKKCDITIAENSGFYLDGGTNKALEVSGIKEVADKYDIKLINLEQIKIKKIIDDKAEIYKELELPEIIFEQDLIINVPKLKTHTLMKYTGAVKNLYGIIPGGRKQILHNIGKSESEFGKILVDIYQNIKPRLNIMDGIIGLEGNGPGSTGIPKKTGLILASASAPALDIVASGIIGYKEDEIYTTLYCKKRGLVEKPEIIGTIPKIPYKKPINMRPPGFILGWIMKQGAMTPYAIKKSCVRCGICKKVCPVKAIGMKPYPKVDKKKCIHCYCCHENCPHNAMDLKGSLIFETIKKAKNMVEKWSMH